MRETLYNNTKLYPTATFDDDDTPNKFHLELCNSKVTHTVHVIPHIKGEANLDYVTLNKEEAHKVMDFLKEFILNG